MKEVKYTCDKCLLPIDGEADPEEGNFGMVGGKELCELKYTQGLMGHNRVPSSGWHFHYSCFCSVVNTICELLKKP